jgi:hypothetical protein
MRLSSGNSPGWMASAALAVTGAVPARFAGYPTVSRSPAPESLAPRELEDFYVAGVTSFRRFSAGFAGSQPKVKS